MRPEVMELGLATRHREALVSHVYGSAYLSIAPCFAGHSTISLNDIPKFAGWIRSLAM
jgi:hypothetical protein